MPKCVQCNETYAEQLRRCPHCGNAPDGRPSAELESSEADLAPAVSPETEPVRKRMWSSRLVIYAALVLVLGGASVVFMAGMGGDAESEVVANAVPRKRTIPKPVVAPKLGPIDEALTVTHAHLEGDDEVWGELGLSADDRATLRRQGVIRDV